MTSQRYSPLGLPSSWPGSDQITIKTTEHCSMVTRTGNIRIALRVLVVAKITKAIPKTGCTNEKTH
jgi:hypothetical protein